MFGCKINLNALGIKIDLTPEQIAKCVDECNVAFMFAPVNHPAMRFVSPVRKKLGVRTCFNILGPMINRQERRGQSLASFIRTSCQSWQVIALKEVARIDHTVIIHGVGLDKISPPGPARLLEIKNVAPEGEPKVYEENQFELYPLNLCSPYQVPETGTAVSQAEDTAWVQCIKDIADHFDIVVDT